MPRFPTLIVSGVMGTFALLLLVCGFILDTVAKKHRQLFEINLNLLRLTPEGTGDDDDGRTKTEPDSASERGPLRRVGRVEAP